ncbi:hypothetical protein HXY33_05465 [Candidatus Bathyarchaeota archaeon]|nr:hypothetical protein [Candidatus Bathyarchaeota archaeon]
MDTSKPTDNQQSHPTEAEFNNLIKLLTEILTELKEIHDQLEDIEQAIITYS